ncbi:MAG: DUF362 domain-containing protein [Ruminiclostridium sp.]
MKKSAGITVSEPIVGIGLGSDYSEVTRIAVENAGGLGSIIKENNTVVIKPNLVKPLSPEDGIVTDYRVIQEIVTIVKRCGAGKVIIAEATPYGDVFELAKYYNISGVELIDMNALSKEDCYELIPQNSLTKEVLFIPKLYMDADVVISVAKLKTHFEYDAGVTLSLKNSMGVPPTKFYGEDYKEKLHLLGLKEAIVDLNKIRKPDFVVIDGIIGGEGYGPLLVRPIKSNIMLAGIDPVAVDTVALTFMGFTLDEVPHVQLASKEGLGISDLSKIKIVGADLNLIKMKFQRV